MERHLSAAEKLPVLPVSVRHLSAAQKVQPAAINGLRGNSFTGTKLVVKPTARASEPKTSVNASCLLFLSGAVVAKYGDKSVYFDLEDLGNTTRKWDLYGSDVMMIQMLMNILVIFLVV
ncbi:hypothetical protein DVH24_026251 [Malus domestica]|uniref:Photosystem I reaction center subunit VI n=1 Tax=Malus domestica TaxID=3750 RepID=A0A498KN47_MALDO|nr:hypothetical protein DVH24_026251 [Malus domestica]